MKRIQEAGQLGAIYADVRRSKALIAAVRAATVTDASGSPVDMSELLGEDDDDTEVAEVPDDEVAGDTAAESDVDTVAGASTGEPAPRSG